MNASVYNPEAYCPICGLRLSPAIGHRCNLKKLAAIDAARTRDCVQVRQPSLAERLKDGFRLLSDDEVVEEDYLTQIESGARVIVKQECGDRIDEATDDNEQLPRSRFADSPSRTRSVMSLRRQNRTLNERDTRRLHEEYQVAISQAVARGEEVVPLILADCGRTLPGPPLAQVSDHVMDRPGGAPGSAPPSTRTDTNMSKFSEAEKSAYKEYVSDMKRLKIKPRSFSDWLARRRNVRSRTQMLAGPERHTDQDAQLPMCQEDTNRHPEHPNSEVEESCHPEHRAQKCERPEADMLPFEAVPMSPNEKSLCAESGCLEGVAEANPQVERLLDWAAELESEKQQLQAQIARNGGQADVWVLRDLDGHEVNARVHNGRYNTCWEILGHDGKPIGQKVTYRPARKATLAEKGFVERWERRQAKAMIVSGLAGARWPHVEAVVDAEETG